MRAVVLIALASGSSARAAGGFGQAPKLGEKAPAFYADADSICRWTSRRYVIQEVVADS